MTDTQLREITAEEMRIGAAGVTPLPIEQSAIWEQYEAVEGRKLWGRFEYSENGKRIALVALYEYSMRGLRRPHRAANVLSAMHLVGTFVRKTHRSFLFA